MCLGIPGQIVAVLDGESGRALAQSGGVKREVNIALLATSGYEPEALVGEWVLIHVGFAMAVIDREEARRALQLLDGMERGENGWN